MFEAQCIYWCSGWETAELVGCEMTNWQQCCNDSYNINWETVVMFLMWIVQKVLLACTISATVSEMNNTSFAATLYSTADLRQQDHKFKSSRVLLSLNSTALSG